MRYFAQAFVIIVGFAAAVLAAGTEQAKPALQNCYAAEASSAPTVCE